MASFTTGATMSSSFPLVISSRVGSSVLHSTSLYFNTKQVTPSVLSQRATSNPSLSIERAKNAPPGQMTTAVPFAFDGSAGKTVRDRKSTRLNSSHLVISYAVFCLKKKTPVTGYSTRSPQDKMGSADSN